MCVLEFVRKPLISAPLFHIADTYVYYRKIIQVLSYVQLRVIYYKATHFRTTLLIAKSALTTWSKSMYNISRNACYFKHLTSASTNHLSTRKVPFTV